MAIDNKLVAAIENGDLNETKSLIKQGADIHCWEGAPLRHASYRGHLHIVQYLISLGVDVHEGADESLTYASEFGHINIVKCLVSNGAETRVNNFETAIKQALGKNQTHVVKYLESVILKEKRIEELAKV